MANHMAEVANMLGVELGEEFYIREDNSIKCRIYNDGLYVDPVSDNICTLTHSGEMLYSLLKGDVAIKRKPWKPKRQDMFWYVAKMVILIASCGKIQHLILCCTKQKIAIDQNVKPNPTVTSGLSSMRRIKFWRFNYGKSKYLL